MNRITILALAMAFALTLSACGETSTATSSGESAETEALQERIAELEAEDSREERQERREERRKERERSAASEPTPEPEPASDPGGDIVVPDVAGLDHQAAQDALQGEGLWLLDEKDATGQGRALLWDRNWEVVRTDPPAGTAVSEDTTIAIFSKKQGE